ncbi:MAG: AtpZ/AtpI family protein [Candidatus Marinimicrobia bacterium]|jgi:F0F1-type ATP synthase assembly protein I|nr:AtpZ/AtpI family protein [Candidatus Neomarinimicrobiota bacterium]MDP7025747.1 AtpZ/AtpI family protein [Candidatus Neomarinimicrobiota bacterium]|tara:strand:+ start:5421 stop:5663 length:243 start_codon:yes stop_codon:yes gene_type:complete
MNQSDKNYVTQLFEAFNRVVVQAGPYMSASYMLIGSILGLGLLGYFLDQWFKTSPWLSVCGLLLGVAIGIWELARVSLRK